MDGTISFDPNLWPCLLDGTKILTVRPERRADEGDVLHVNDLGLALYITRVDEGKSLGAISAIHHADAGAPDVQTFRRRWKRYYGSFNRKRKAVVHWFDAVHTPRSIGYTECHACGDAPAMLVDPGRLLCRDCRERSVRAVLP